jgi:hypothetical protein
VEQSGNRSSTCGVLSAKFCISDEVLMMHGVSLQKLFSVLLICSCWNMASNVADIRTVEEWPHTVHSFCHFGSSVTTLCLLELVVCVMVCLVEQFSIRLYYLWSEIDV